MESASLVGAHSPALNTKCSLPSCPTKLGWISERSKRYARKKLASNRAVRVRSEKSEGEGGFDIDRRSLLLSSSTLGLSTLTAGNALSLPFPPPDFSSCVYPTDLPTGAVVKGDCCPPYSSNTTTVDFEFPKNLPMRTRVPAHLVGEAYIKKYDAAISAMKALPEDDPRSFTKQANVHCAYCNGAYLVGAQKQDYAIHKCWFFAPWHRWYLYFYERILAKLINDDTFALPFWNWDTAVGMSIPPMFTNTQLSIYNENRDPCHQPPQILNLLEPTSCDDGSVKTNYAQIYTHMVSGATTPLLFHGAVYRFGDEDSDLSYGTLETSPHNMVHAWTGSPKNTNREDMGSLYSAGRDPLFYCHHANVDRMWYIWNSVLGRKNIQDPDLLNSKFLFYDENKQLVQVRAGDAYDLNKLRYCYQEVDLPWLTDGRSLKKAGTLKAKPAVEKFNESPNQLTELKGPVSVRVKRPTQKRSSKEKNEAEEVLSVEGIELDVTQSAKFGIFLNLPDADASTSLDNPHFAGSFVHFGHGKHEMKTTKTTTNRKLSYKVGITETLEDIGATEDESIIVTLVPQASKFQPKEPIKFTSVKISYDNK
uniref:TSA: Wollemia nobilis Ref_Wollemi_Transcript_14401_2252 transcribed RNA sequence n=1 Tax=Wollemia nobilis TaxID=56998 RepID=A0A0C9S6R6_9CONI